MLIVTKHFKDRFDYSSSTSSPLEREIANKKYYKLRDEISNLFPKPKGEKNIFYFKIGQIISKFIKENKLSGTDLTYSFSSARSIIDNIDPNFQKDDYKRNRIVCEHFYLLSHYDAKVVEQTSWSNWTYFFQNIYISNIRECHLFFSNKIKSKPEVFKEGFIRLYCMILNSFFKDKPDLSDWDNKRKLVPIKVAYEILITICETYNIYNRDIYKKVKISIEKILKNTYKEYLRCYLNEERIIKYKELVISSLINELTLDDNEI